MKRVIIAGITGSMGQKATELVQNMADCQLVAVVSPDLTNDAPVISLLPSDTKRFKKLDDIDVEADIWIDFTIPSAVYENTKFALEHNIHPIIGTSGLTSPQVEELKEIAKKQGVGGIIVPNFSLSAVLLMKFAAEASKYFPDAEVIEMHHSDKLDAPSGTAISTAEQIAASRSQLSENQDNVVARGADCHGVKVHSVRLPGYVAHEQVLFGGTGEALTIRQDSFDRSSFIEGIKLAIDHVLDIQNLEVGLDKIL